MRNPFSKIALRTIQALLLITGISAVMIIVAALGAVAHRKLRAARQEFAANLRQFGIVSGSQGLQGLSQAEVDALSHRDRAAEGAARRRNFVRSIIRANLVNIFSINLVGNILLMFLLGNPAGALVSGLFLALNVTLNVLVMLDARKRLEVALQEAQPQVIAVRGGVLRGIEPADIVPGDLLLIRPGDQVVVAGEMVGEGELDVEPIDTAAPPQVRRPGDMLGRDMVCVRGQGFYRASEAGQDALPDADTRFDFLQRVQTPFQRLLNTTLLLLLATQLVFVALLVITSATNNINLVSDQGRAAFSLLATIAPTGLFFVLVIQYAIGAKRLADLGALVRDVQSIEELSQVSVVCVSKSSIVSDLEFDIETLQPTTHPDGLGSERKVRRVLGDAFASLPIFLPRGARLGLHLPGTPRVVHDYAPHLREHGWLGASFAEDGYRMTLVLGQPEVLEPALVKEAPAAVREVRHQVSRLGLGLFGLRRGTPAQATEVIPVADPNDTAPAHEPPAGGSARARGRVERLFEQWNRLLVPMEEREKLDSAARPNAEAFTLSCAYRPEPVPLHDAHGQPQLPGQLIPLARLHIYDSIHPDAAAAIKRLQEGGVRVKLLSPDGQAETDRLARQLAIRPIGTVVPVDAAAPPDLLRSAAFSNVTPVKQVSVVAALRAAGETVAMVGSDLWDIPAMRQANCGVALRSDNRAVAQAARLILLDASLEPLLGALLTGQRLLNGVLGTLQLNLSQAAAYLIMIVTMPLIAPGNFPVTPALAGMISLFTIGLPNAVLAAWSATGRSTGRQIVARLLRFVLPLSLALAGLGMGLFMAYRNDAPRSFLTPVIAEYGIRSPQIYYAQLVAAYTLLGAGWLRVLFLQPPTPFWTGASGLRGDRRVLNTILVMMIVFVVMLVVPLLRDLFDVYWLELKDYLTLIPVLGLWAAVLLLFWRFVWRKRS